MYATDTNGKFIMAGDKVVDSSGKFHLVEGYAGYNFITTQEGHFINAVQCEVVEATNITFTQYQDMAKGFCLYPDEHKEEAYTYGIASEVGEYLSLCKKYLRGDSSLDNNKCLAELGDICWYVANWLLTMGMSVSYAQQNLQMSSRELKEELIFFTGNALYKDVWAFVAMLDVVNTLIEQEHNSSMSDVLRGNLGKLTRRYYAKSIRGSGDER